MIYPTEITLDQRYEAEALFKKKFPKLELEYSPGFKHYYIFNPKTKEKTGNISLYEFYYEVMKNLK